MKRVFSVIFTVVSVLLISSCGIMGEFVTAVMDHWEQSEASTPEQKAIAQIWNNGGDRGKVVVAGAAATDLLNAFGVKGADEISNIQKTAQEAIGNTKATGNQWVDLGLTAAYYGAAFADNHIAKKKNQDFANEVSEHARRYNNPEDPSNYDPYYDYRYEIDYENRQIKRRPFADVIKDIRSADEAKTISSTREELIACGILPEWQYIELFGEFNEKISENEDQYRMYVAQLRDYVRKQGCIPGTYDASTRTYKSYEDYYQKEGNTERMQMASMVETSGTVESNLATECNGTKSESYVKEDVMAMPEKTQVEKLSEVLENTKVQRFAFNSIVLTDAQKLELDELAKVLEDNELSVCVTGHTCSIGTESANYSVGLKRAESAKKYLVDNGVSESRIIVASAGSSMPIASNDTVEGRGENRRISFAVQD